MTPSSSSDLLSYFSNQDIATIPTPSTSPISRWSLIHISTPALIVRPRSESDILAALKCARDHNLTVVPAGGTHGVGTPVDKNTLYLDLGEMTDVVVNVDDESVTFAGGAMCEGVLKKCVDKGFYALIANSGTVGMTAYHFGGGNSAFSGRHGLAMDHIISLRIITGDGSVHTLSPYSTGEQGQLFNTLRGAGYGLGIVSSMTVKIFKIADLHLSGEDGKYWMRQLMFTASKIDLVADIFLSLFPLSPNLLPVLICARAPPTAPSPGAPVIILTLNYFGPTSEAEDSVSIAASLNEDVASQAISADRQSISIADVTAGAKMVEMHGGYKMQYACRTRGMSKDSIVKGVQRWIEFGDKTEDARARTALVITGCSPDAAVAYATSNNNENPNKGLFVGRDRAHFNQVMTWYSSSETSGQAEEFGEEMLGIFREEDRKNGVEDAGFANNLRVGMDLGEVYTKEMQEEIRKVKERWDAQGVFYCPVLAK